MSVKFDAERTYSYIKGMAIGLRWTNTIKALAYARAKHSEQKRKNGELYIIHPLTVASHAIALGVRDDATIAACLLHDVLEDCGATPNDLPVGPEVKEIVVRLTYVPQMGCGKTESLNHYYKNISENHKACLVKLLDRCNNVSTMAGVFSREKMMDYIKETNAYILPLLRETKENWSEDSALLYSLKYQIISVIDAIEACMDGSNNEHVAREALHMAAFSKRLEMAIEHRGLTHAQLSKKTGIGAASIGRFLSGQYEPGADAACKLADVLKVSVEWLMGYKPEQIF